MEYERLVAVAQVERENWEELARDTTATTKTRKFARHMAARSRRFIGYLKGQFQKEGERRGNQQAGA